MSRFKDLTGKRFGKLTATAPNGISSDRCRIWSCVCDCGNVVNVKSASLNSGNTKSCGCYYIKDFTEQKFGRLTAKNIHHRTKRDVGYWECLCECGNIVIVGHSHLVSGDVSSCGCRRVEVSTLKATTHDGSKDPEYQVYNNAKRRCNEEKSKQWKDYGGRGIKFLFNSYEEFISHVGKRPSNLYSLDRINNDGNYEIGNVRWATKQEQARNRRCNNCEVLKNRIAVLEAKIIELESKTV